MSARVQGGWDARLAARPVWSPPPRAASGRALAVTAHPDDEVLALGGVLLALVEDGWRVDLLVLTDGEAAYPGLDAAAARRLGAVRRGELDRAWAQLGLAGRGDVERAGLPDARLPAAEDRAADAVALAAARGPAPELVVGLWEEDPHADHACAARVAAAWAGAAGVPLVRAPLWARVWWDGDDDRLPWARTARVPLGAAAARRRDAALAAHASQVRGFEGRGPLLGAADVAALAGDGLVVLP